MAALTSGQTLLDRFTLVRPLGQGGQSRVWLAEDRELEERVVLKIVPSGVSDDRIHLLRRECRHARKLVHPAIVVLYDFHRGEEFSFISMAWVDGSDIGSLRRAEPDVIVRTLLPVVEALEHAHGHGVIHRDVKVSNVMLDQASQARLLDFGIAGLLAEDGEQVSGGGSRYNVSPQQLAGDAPQPADDVYGMGVLLYELITGRPPFWPAVSDERVRTEAPRPLESDHAIAEPLQSLIAAMLAKAPGERPATMGRVRDALAATIEGPATSQGGSGVTDAKSGVRLTAPPRIEPVAPPLKWSAAKQVGRDRRARRLRWGTAFGIVVLLAALAGVVWVLPRWAEARRAAARETPPADVVGTVETPPPPQPGPGVPPPPTAEFPDADEPPSVSAGDVRDALARAREWVDTLEQRRVGLWGGEDWTRGKRRLTDAEIDLTAGRNADALAAAEEAAALFEGVASGGVAVLQQALRDGQQALRDGDSIAARAAFELATAVAPESEQARSGLARAAVLDQVVASLDSGQQNERRGNLEAAAEDYRKAVEIDPLSERALEALNRLDSRIAEHAFARVMSEGLTALNRGDYRTAKDAFGRAIAERPAAAEARDGLVQAEEGLRIEAIAHHRELAVAAEADERWSVAAENYSAVLELAPAIRFAQDGQARSAKRADLAGRIDFHLSNPGRLQADNVLNEAHRILAEAEEIAPAGPRHQDQIGRLSMLLAAASTPIPIRLESDEATDVTIYKIGRLGTFLEHRVNLRPGIYTVVGSRRGYRDVRVKLTVVAGQAPDPVIVRCEEEI